VSWGCPRSSWDGVGTCGGLTPRVLGRGRLAFRVREDLAWGVGVVGGGSFVVGAEGSWGDAREPVTVTGPLAAVSSWKQPGFPGWGEVDVGRVSVVRLCPCSWSLTRMSQVPGRRVGVTVAACLNRFLAWFSGCFSVVSSSLRPAGVEVRGTAQRMRVSSPLTQDIPEERGLAQPRVAGVARVLVGRLLAAGLPVPRPPVARLPVAGGLVVQTRVCPMRASVMRGRTRRLGRRLGPIFQLGW